MQVYDLLLVGIEASIALAGFAGIIATFQLRDPMAIRRGPVASLTVVVQYSLLSAVGCMAPLLLHAFGTDEHTLWAISSTVGAIFTLYGGYGVYRNIKGAFMKRSIIYLFIGLQILGGLVVLINILNVADIIFHREPGPFIVSVVYALGVAGFIFSRLLLLPLWKAVKVSEANGEEMPSNKTIESDA